MQSVTKGIVSEGPLYSLLSTLLAVQVFRMSGQLPWSSVAAMQLGALRLRRLYFASRTENRVVFRVARVAKTRGFCMSWFGTDPDRRRQ
jgi:hypothetical protein